MKTAQCRNCEKIAAAKTGHFSYNFTSHFKTIRPTVRRCKRLVTHYSAHNSSTESLAREMDNGSVFNAMRFSNHSESGSLMYQASLKGHEGPALVVFSGGTAFNSVAGHLRQLTTRVTHILPVSDDGGSTAEIVRVLGGPAVGDIRSRCLRLADDTDAEARAVRKLLAHRLSGESAERAKMEWYEVVEGDHSLWEGVSEPYKHTIRAFLVYFHSQIQRHSTERFNFRNGSVGNFFFAGARLFFRSLEAAIFLFSRVARIPEGSLVLPAICTEERITLGAEMANGTIIRGQNEISHPAAPESPGPIRVDKHGRGPPLAAPVRRIFYLSAEGTMREHEVFPPPNPRLLTQVDTADALVYGMGSLYTSICPSLVLKGVGEKIAERDIPKIFLLNGSHDRETSASKSNAGPMTACDVVLAVCDALNRRHAKAGQPLDHPPSAYVTALLVPQGGAIVTDIASLEAIGIREVVEVPAIQDRSGNCLFEPGELVRAIERIVQ
ncbi:g13164 [Coccomyxa viridis]|uniref:G13164 protein n=1 Tax=Coccomyxa viridis TaxID=1274662 RepID=A0ABP1GC52_9CHLO